MSKDGGDQTTTTTTELPEWLEPYMEDLVGWSWDAFQEPLTWYPESVVPEFSEYTTEGMQSIYDIASQGVSEEWQTGFDTLASMASGEYWDPYLADMTSYSVSQALPGVYSSAEMAGATGSALAADAAATAAQEAQAGMYGDLFGLSLQAALGIPGYEQTQYAPAEALLGLGAMEEARKAAILQEAADAYMFEQSEEMDRVLALMGGYSGLLGSGGETVTETEGGGTDWLSSLLGAGMFAAPFFL